ncbi:MAG: hypothetical protein IPP73_07075 [Chitinophagaceae bacterium]|nr:hypothetical protein [Chitinophagaceae bacterium]
MKKLLSILVLSFLASVTAFSQAPGIFNYQGVARNSVGNVLQNKPITLRLTIHDGTAAGPTVYSETRAVITNPYGLFNVQVGSPGASSSTGSIAGTPWAVGNKFIQVEIDPNGGSAFINIGTAQLAAVPYALYANQSGDIVLPFNKTQADNGTLFKITNSGTASTSTALEGLTNSTAGNAFAIIGTVTPTSPGGFSSGVRGINNGTGGLGIGVYGSQNGSGWGVYGTTPSGIGVHGNSATGFGVYGLSTSGVGVYGNSSTGRSGLFENTNAANTSNAVEINQAGTGFGLRVSSTNGTPRALQTIGGVQHTGLGEALNFVLRSDAAGNGTWVDPAVLLPGANYWTKTGTNLFATTLTDNVGVGTNTPTHKFTVTHTGSTGIGITSTSGFSVLDIDAASGDAAIRFGNAGVNQWNMRNRPGDNYLEWFELGGGGSRMVIQDATGNVGIGETVNPTYKLDVLHGGSTGIRSRSSGSFSVVDIDAASGDAALRFQKAGVGQWNTRNRPADDYFEIFELGGGGSRFVIQDATGNVGIGETTNPTYKLDVLHGGSTGIRSRSSGSFSVVDIDAASGDAALRFANNGVNQWNTRNRPADDYYEIFELGGGGSRVVIQDGTGNVGIGETTNPTYKLDVLHGGATGIRSRSSGTFSLMDIDAANGDAALRFAKAGVNQWNTRNRPADDYYEIFELGGGGSRFVIQDGTGNVGIGETTNPTYKLDVLHGGATGIRSRSSGTFSVIDIDGANGDAALRFQKAGVNQWNTRNNPATDDYQIFELGGGGERMRIDDATGKVWVNQDFTVIGVKAFTMDHPLDPENKLLMHAAAESNEVINFYSGNVTTDATGKATVQLPDYFEAINKDFRYQLTVLGTFAQAIISKEVSNNHFEISTNQPNVKVSWEVKGVRNDARMQMHPFTAVAEKTPAQKGKYVDAESHHQPLSKGVSYDANLQSSLNDVQPALKKATPPTTGGSLDQQAIVAPVTSKPVDQTGSTADVEVKKVEEKKADIKGTSVETVPVKPVEEKKPVANSVPESTKTN